LGPHAAIGSKNFVTANKSARGCFPLNHPLRYYFRGRENPLRSDEIVDGEFLSLIYSSHDPFVLLIDHDDLASLEARILGRGGLLNRFITYLVAFISGKVAKYRITYVGPDGTILPFDKYSQWRVYQSGKTEYPISAIEWL